MLAIEGQHMLKDRQGVFPALLLEKTVAKLLVGFDMVRLEAQGGLQRGDSLLVPALGRRGHAAGGVSLDIIRAAAHRYLITRDVGGSGPGPESVGEAATGLCVGAGAR